ncbi:MAG: Uma2 family endonuclease [Polyangiales bacterium]
MAPLSATRLVIPVPPTLDRWALEEDDVPETVLHERVIGLLLAIFNAWIVRASRDALAGSNLALRFDAAQPQRGVDPDVYLVEPAPPEGERTTSLRLWEAGHHPPRVAVEVVSESTARKDYDLEDGPARYAAAGVKELWVFDPLLLGPNTAGGPWVLQVWRRSPKGSFRRVYQGAGPAYSRELRAWLVVTDGGTRLRLAEDAAGKRLWPTLEEEERAAKERERAAKERERAAKERERAAKERERAAKEEERSRREAAEAEVARLRALLAGRDGG